MMMMMMMMMIIKFDTPDLDNSSCEGDLLYERNFKKMKFEDGIISTKGILIKVEEPLDYAPSEEYQTNLQECRSDPLVCSGPSANNELISEIDFDNVKSEFQQAFENKLVYDIGTFIKEELIEDIPQYTSIKNHVDDLVSIKRENICDDESNYVSLKDKEKTILAKPITEEYKCHICGYKCKYLRIYQNHISSHEVLDSLSLFSCSECDYRCSKKNKLTSHMKSHKNAFTCSECGKSFIFNEVLTKDELLHKINKHMLIHKRKQCHGCEKIFSTKQGLKKHITLQSTKKPVKCTECDKNFTLKCTFKIHMKTHIEHLFECTKCRKSFSQKGNLYRHLRKHSGKHITKKSPSEQVKQLILQYPLYNNLLQLHLENSTSDPKINYNPTALKKHNTSIYKKARQMYRLL